MCYWVTVICHVSLCQKDSLRFKKKCLENSLNFSFKSEWEPCIKVVTFRLHGWCVLGVFLLTAFTRLGHDVRIFWVRAMKCMRAQTRPRFILSSERVFGGMEFEPMLSPREKSPLPENIPRGGSNPWRCGQRVQTLPTSYSGPPPPPPPTRVFSFILESVLSVKKWLSVGLDWCHQISGSCGRYVTDSVWTVWVQGPLVTGCCDRQCVLSTFLFADCFSIFWLLFYFQLCLQIIVIKKKKGKSICSNTAYTES